MHSPNLIKIGFIAFIGSICLAGLGRAEEDAAFIRYFAEHKPCVLAWDSGKQPDFPEMYKRSMAGKGYFDVYCVFDGVENAGALDEIRGCMLGSFNPYLNGYRHILKKLKGEPCTYEAVKRLFNKVLTENFVYQGDNALKYGLVFQKDDDVRVLYAATQDHLTTLRLLIAQLREGIRQRNSRK